MKKTKLCVDAVEKLQKVTGISEIDDLGEEFERMESRNLSLVAQTNQVGFDYEKSLIAAL